MFQIKKASRNQVKVKIGMSSVSGGGKTMSALLLAKGLVGDLSKVCLIDSENGSASLYSHLGDYDTLNLAPPYSPERYVQAIRFAFNQKKYECIIVDSVSHEWEGSGGCLEIHERLGGRFQDWAVVTPMHRDFIDTILQTPIHIITTARRKQDYTLDKNENGKPAPKKVGLKEVQRDGWEYELTVNFDIDINHTALASKDRTGLFSSKAPFHVNEEVGKKIKAWNDSGAEAPVVIQDLVTKPVFEMPDPESMPHPGEYKLTFGKNKGLSLNDMGVENVKKYVEWLENDSRSKGMPIKGAALEFKTMADSYLALKRITGENPAEPPAFEQQAIN